MNNDATPPLARRITLSEGISWVVAVFLALAGLVNLLPHPLGGGLFILAAVVTLPTFSKALASKYNVVMSRSLRITTIVVLFLLGSLVSASKTTTEVPALTTNQTVTTSAPKPIENTTATPTPKVVNEPKVIAPTNVSAPKPTITYQVVRVVDGDTITVSQNGVNQTLRLIGLNTPETVDPRKPVECFGQEASAKAKELLTGKTVTLEADPTQGELDKYNRLLRYVYLPDGRLYNKLMIEQGYAYEYTYNLPYKYQAQFKQAESEARAAKRGLWADDACEDTSSVTQTPAPTQTVTVPPSTGGDKDCKDFSTQAQAQAYFESKGGSATNNVDRLDGSDHDGVVCESLP